MVTDYNDIIGKEFNRLTVMERGPDYIQASNGRRCVRYWCQCSCGHSQKLVRRDSLLNGSTKSCGCLGRETQKRLGEQWSITWRKHDKIRNAIRAQSDSYS